MDESVSPRVAPPIVDDRGILQVLLNKEIKSTVLITSNKGAVRANH